MTPPLPSGCTWENIIQGSIYAWCDTRWGSCYGAALPYAIEQWRICHLLLNCYICFNDNQASGTGTFAMPPPDIDWNLWLWTMWNDEDIQWRRYKMRTMCNDNDGWFTRRYEVLWTMYDDDNGQCGWMTMMDGVREQGINVGHEDTYW